MKSQNWGTVVSQLRTETYWQDADKGLGLHPMEWNNRKTETLLAKTQHLRNGMCGMDIHSVEHKLQTRQDKYDLTSCS